MKQVSHKIVDNGGIIRSIQNHGVREFPHRVQAKYPDYKTGRRYYEKGRYISLYYDASPNTIKDVEKILSMNDQVLRNSHLKARSKLDYISIQKEDKNPYVKSIKATDRSESEKRAAEDLAISTARADTAVDAIMEQMRDDA
jgi:ribosomal protein S6